MAHFSGNIFIIGCGAVAQCFLDILIKNLSIKPSQCIVLDPNIPESISDYRMQGLNFIQNSITEKNYSHILGQYLKKGDICIDLATGISTIEILSWCHDHQIHYINTCLNNWSDQKEPLYNLHTLIQSVIETWPPHSSTAILSHGVNPGLVSSFAKQACLDLAAYVLSHEVHKNSKEIESALINEEFARLAFLLEITHIHISETDTQIIPSISQNQGTFLNTWSIVEFINECITKSEIAKGSFTQLLPEGTIIMGNTVLLPTRAMHTFQQSWCYPELFVGIIPPHDEIYSLSDFFSYSVPNGQTYRPWVSFVYKPSPAAMASLLELEQNNFIHPKKFHIMKDEIIDGADTLGCLLLRDKQPSWWTGSAMTIQESNQITPGHNATITQTASGVLAAFIFIINNPNKGVLLPEQLPHSDIINSARAYLGKFISTPVPITANDCAFLSS